VPACSRNLAATPARPQHHPVGPPAPSRPRAGSLPAARKLRLNKGGDDVWPGGCHLSAEVAELLGHQDAREPCTFSLFLLPGFWRTSAPSLMSLQRDAGLQHLPASTPPPTEIPDGAAHATATGPSAEKNPKPTALMVGPNTRPLPRGSRAGTTLHPRAAPREEPRKPGGACPSW